MLSSAFYEKLRPCTSDDRKVRVESLKKMCDYVRDLPQSKLQAMAGALFLFARDAPFAEMRESFRKLLQELKVRYRNAPDMVSAFFNFDTAGVIRACEEEDDREMIHDIFRKTFARYFRVPHLYKVLVWHPSYLARYHDLIDSIMCAKGSLSLSARHYIAIMAASRHDCRYLAATHMSYFRRTNGDERWLNGVQHVPEKLRKLTKLNALLAHQPWMVTSDHIKELTTGTHSWAIGDLVQALVLMCLFHGTCGVSYALGVLPETDIARMFYTAVDEGGRNTRSSSARDSGELLSGEGANLLSIVELEAARLNPNFADASTKTAMSGLDGSDSPAETVRMSNATFAPNAESERQLRTVLTKDLNEILKKESEKNLEQLFHSAATDDASSLEAKLADPSNADIKSSRTLVEVTSPIRTSRSQEDDTSDLIRFTGNIPMGYVDFFMAARAHELSVLRVQDYSWDTQGYAIASRFFSSSADLIDGVFREIYSLTYYTLGSSDDIDTEPLRRAVWYYAQSLLGVRNDDFDYRQVNITLDRKLKVFVKKTTCSPENISKEDWDFSDVLTPSERCHIALLAANARIQASLLYALRAVHKTMM
eukprot:g3.t1